MARQSRSNACIDGNHNCGLFAPDGQVCACGCHKGEPMWNEYAKQQGVRPCSKCGEPLGKSGIFHLDTGQPTCAPDARVPATPQALLREFIDFSGIFTDFDIWESEAWRVRKHPSAQCWYVTYLVGGPHTGQYMTSKEVIAKVGGGASGRAFISRDFPGHPF